MSVLLLVETVAVARQADTPVKRSVFLGALVAFANRVLSSKRRCLAMELLEKGHVRAIPLLASPPVIAVKFYHLVSVVVIVLFFIVLWRFTGDIFLA